jgi:high frequency lysogenization protein
MKYTQWEYQNIALACVAQSAALVEALAVRGDADDTAIKACILPLMNFNPSSVSEIYPQISALNLGLRTMQSIFSSNKHERSGEIIRYVLGILALRQKLMSDEGMQAKVHSSLDSVALSIDPYSDDVLDAKFFEDLAKVYQDTISTYSFRIHVKGNMEHLKDEVIANKIRGLLLAGIRSAVLWYQIGGRRWHLILYRKKIKDTSEQIRKNLITTV